MKYHDLIAAAIKFEDVIRWRDKGKHEKWPIYNLFIIDLGNGL